jgi:predicted peptidase
MGNVDALIAKILELRTKLSDLATEVEETNAEKAQLESDLMEFMASTGTTQLGSSMGTATMKVSTKFALSNWDQFIKYVVETESFDMLQKRISSKAVGERLAAEEEVPGIQGVQVYSVSIRKK